MMVRIVTIIHLSEGSTQPEVYMIRIQLDGPSPWSSKWGDQPYVRLGSVAEEAGARRVPMQGAQVWACWVWAQSLGRHVVTIPTIDYGSYSSYCKP